MNLPHVPIAELYEIYLRHPAISIDSRRVSPGGMFVAFRGDRVDGNRYAAAALREGAAYAIVDDPSVIPSGDEVDRYLLVDDSLVSLQQLARRHREEFLMPVLAITGSNGKTTTKELIAAVMSRQYAIHATPGNYNNHLGLPLTILSMPAGTDLLILEMGANHQGEIAALCEIGRPTHGLVTNVGDAHLEGFGGREGVIKGKAELYQFLAATGGVAFVNTDEAHLRDMAGTAGRVIPYFTSEAPSPFVQGVEVKTGAVHPHIEVSFLSEHRELVTLTTHLSGEHNLQNVKSAIAVGKYFKVPAASIVTALETYRSENHRSQWLAHRGVDFYWDAYNANPSSVIAALSGFRAASSPEDSVVVLGEMLELGRESAAAHRKVVLRAGQVARTVLLVGPEMAAVAREFERPHFADSAALSEWFWQQDWTGKKIFVKGSRGNRLEVMLAEDHQASISRGA
ncbi:UDP-N-acetylmuramoyl-tripeptide--D-alanyl-D-alanine ligase [Lewinella aquimaris]|uniref:UDP-N-acetylmuramoyl-tripeptide--D-alanyl-D-alanine ligase n=1 Tax=Neolewinella aquimaris TaxID=1835722 RepID=A0A840ED75_9BACT|nr:UDP-N-acetylmuramoyl-tripeptide--D-alanyl-D-alanine ligase [Neolewinella aquimaris]MBB4078896.1 UDP-N-acetylmuramoyl-tripeptide--D-alanyl-D-alanine ligase [Neolewinella aquimaris]